MHPQPFLKHEQEGGKTLQGVQAPFLFRLPPVRRNGWAENDAIGQSLPTHSMRTTASGYPPGDREGMSKSSTDASAETPRDRVVRRQDMPIIRKREFGAISLAMEAARTVKSRQQALLELEKDMYARTSAGPREALLATWEKFHTLWYGDAVPVLPLTEDKLVHVTALFKAGGYKSYKNYLSRLKDAHVMMGYPWTDLLQRVAQKCSRSALRGLAGPSRSEPFDLIRTFQSA